MIDAQIAYHDVPAEVSHVTAYQWQQGSPPVPLVIAMTRNGTEMSLTLSLPSAVVVLLQRADGAYLLDGPIAGRDLPAERAIDRTWRRTIDGGVTAAPGAPPPLDWITAAGATGLPWPACWWRSPSRWECMGVPLEDEGVVIGPEGDRVLSAVVSGESTPILRASAWSRLLVVGDRAGIAPPHVRVTAARPVAPSQRAHALRLDTAVVGDVRVTSVAPGVYWIAGDSSPPDAWLEIRSARSGPQYLPLADVAQGSPLLPMRALLEDRRDVAVVIASTRGDPAAGAVVTAFRLIDPQPPSSSPDQPPPRRVVAGEAIAAADGTASIDGLGEADYEIVAWHPQLGRGTMRLAAGATQATIRLQAPGLARGRVLSGGTPAAGIEVFSVPDPAAYRSAADPIDLKGGDARTGPDGRFVLALAPGGGGELRVGGGTHPVVRVPLPRAVLPLVELGDIELGQPVSLTVTLDQDPGCDLRATGPVGRSGLQIVGAARTGPGLFAITLPEEGTWEFVLICGRAERALAPAVVTISARDGPRDVRLTVR
jgi:hypothetical protein